MTDRKPDFYRVVRVRGGVREYMWSHGWSVHARNAETFTPELADEMEHAERIEKKHGGRIVPVYVKVTRKPKLHDFAWALRRMREGKRVRRVGWSSYEYIWLADAALNRLAWNSDCAATVGNEALFATDWQLYEAP